MSIFLIIMKERQQTTKLVHIQYINESQTSLQTQNSKGCIIFKPYHVYQLQISKNTRQKHQLKTSQLILR
ncbi:hypothetical protein Hanom_Chr08g00742321 [Helianthus anomalus]